jgi:hypothetical protein
MVGLAAILGIAASAPAEAQWTDLLNQCSTGTVRTCASFSAQVTDLGGGRSRLQIRVRNLYGVLADGTNTGSILAQLGVVSPDLVNVVNDSPLATAVEGATEVGSPGDNWNFHSSTNRLGEVTWALAAGSNGGNSNGSGGIFGCLEANGTRAEYFTTCVDGAPGGWVEFSLTANAPIDVNQLQLAWGVMSVGPEDYSIQGTTCVAGNCGGDVVPEPITMVLMGTGLLGIGAAQRRRRRENAISNELT